MQAFAERILALGCKFEDDSQIARHPQEGDSRDGAAIEAVRWDYFPDAAGAARTAAVQATGVGKGPKSKAKAPAWFADADLPFLEKRDALDGRLVENANYCSVATPDEHSDHVLADLLMNFWPATV